MSTDTFINTINSSNADMLVVALTAKKGQAWMRRNYDRLRIPVRLQFGATINFQAGTLRRAPALMQNCGLEWLWRIKEEPQLWRRYWNDGIVLLQLLLTRVAPLLFLAQWDRLRWGRRGQDILIQRTDDPKDIILNISGSATAQNVGNAISVFREAAPEARNIVINFTDTCLIDGRFIGLLLMLNKQLKRQQVQLKFAGFSPRIERIFRLNGFGFLLRA
jgi:N-acetylglucosaminyldiphosphoundecaprenol N-acetyl-beta-D-mannosaminyltransferase